MECNNTYCYWCTFEQCCHEEETVHGNEELQKPSQLDCPSTLRSDFEESLWWLYDWLYDLFEEAGIDAEEKLKHKNFHQMLEIYNLINNVWRINDEISKLKEKLVTAYE